MRLRGPVLTLLAVAGLALALLVVDVSQTPSPAPDQVARTAPAPTAGTVTSAPAVPPAPAFPVEAVYTGRSSGDQVTVAIAVREGQAAGYVCDGERVEAWLEGQVRDGELRMEGMDGATVTARADGDAVFGRVRVAGGQWPYAAQVAAPPAGLYEAVGTVDGVTARIGWIVLADGSQVGVATVDGEHRPAPRLDLARGGATVGGVFVAAEVVRGDDTG
ncbi:MAG: hypothetical protein L0K86_16985 [Actinomycetia bacterium]|nr:hypothetical protein [Actinomycetes bacterium]